jgi:hypothetical protein
MIMINRIARSLYGGHQINQKNTGDNGQGLFDYHSTINTFQCVNSELHKTENPELALSPNVAASKDHLRARICSRSGDAQSPVLLVVMVHFDTI